MPFEQKLVDNSSVEDLPRYEFADNHAVDLEICRRWFSSDAGQVAIIEAPTGYANIRAHAMLHQAQVLKQ